MHSALPPLLPLLDPTVTGFSIDPELHASLTNIREAIRRLFEQLRLRGENGDVSGRERLERVPALAKRNFANLTHPNPELATKEAWRLVDFLEGRDEARLTPLAREALRPVELDCQLARLRGSDTWKEAAAGLRRALGAMPSEALASAAAEEADGSGVDRSDADHAPRREHRDPLVAASRSLRPPDRSRRRPLKIVVGVAALGAVALLIALWPNARPDPRFACLALERASPRALAAH